MPAASPAPVFGQPLTPTQLMQLQHKLAVRQVIVTVESEGAAVDAADGRWWDVAPMLSQHEHCAAFIDMSREELDFGLAAGALARHPTQPNLVRVLAKDAP